MKNVMKFLKNKSGATAIEYGLIVAVLSLVVVAGVGSVGDAVREMFSNQDREIQKAFND